jgi:signal peptidase
MNPLTFLKDQFDENVLALRQLWANKRALLFQLLNLSMIVFSALMIWKGLMVLTQSESPVVVVLSGSMEPAFHRGDILFLNNRRPRVDVGDIVVFKITGRDIPIVHRVLRVHSRELDNGTLSSDYLTKGDNNPVDDRTLYAVDQLWLRRPEILGTAIAALPHVGYVTIILQDYPVLKFLMVGLMALFVLTGKET